MNMEVNKIVDGLFDGTYEDGSIAKAFQNKVNSQVEKYVENNIASEQTIVEFKKEEKVLKDRDGDWTVKLDKSGSDYHVILSSDKGSVKGTIKMAFGKEKDAKDIFDSIEDGEDVMVVSKDAERKKSSKGTEVDLI